MSVAVPMVVPSIIIFTPANFSCVSESIIVPDIFPVVPENINPEYPPVTFGCSAGPPHYM